MSAQRSMQCARTLLRALQKEPARVARTANPAAAATRVAASDLQAAGSFQKYRWASAASPLPKHVAPEPCPTMHTASFSTVSPSVSDKPGAAPGGPSDDAATTVAGSEEKDEPIKPPFTGDGKGGTGVRQDLVKENEELLGLLSHQQALLEEKDHALTEAKDKLLRSYAEMENLRDRTRREAESTRKYSIQDFAKSLLDIADNLGRALETVRKSESSAADAEANAKLLKSLLEGVEMTDKQLIKVFEKHDLERFNPEGEVFDPNEHQAVFEVEDGTKTPGTVAVVLKSGYKLHDRVIRPAVVGVVKAKSE